MAHRRTTSIQNAAKSDFLLLILCVSLCLQEAESLYKTMVKRFRQNKAVWLSYGSFLLQQGQSNAASALLQRALASLPAKESMFAWMDPFGV